MKTVSNIRQPPCRYDFTSSLYLGMRHPHQALSSWGWLTKGKPSAMDENRSLVIQEKAFSKLSGCEDGVFVPSTLHGFWDIFGMMDRVVILRDSGIYPIMNWGLARARLKGIPIKTFRHRDPDHLSLLLRKVNFGKRIPVVVADGFCTGCGRSYPLSDYLSVIEPYGGVLVVDDTQSFGILGERPCFENPYGQGGGGILAWFRFDTVERVIVLRSLAKGFGVPVAHIAANSPVIEYFKKHSECRIHCSPPSAADLSAAARALYINACHGDALRLHLLNLIRFFQKGLKAFGLTTLSPYFPVQTLFPLSDRTVMRLHHLLKEKGVDTIIQGPHKDYGKRISFILSAMHRFDDISGVLDILGMVLKKI